MTSLPVIPPAVSFSWRAVGLRVYRLLVLAAIVCMVRQVATRARVDADLPLSTTELLAFYPTATALQTDTSDRLGLFVADSSGKRLGYVLRTSPQSDHIKGYAGPIDTLIAMDADMKVIGIQVRRTSDTVEHVGKVIENKTFMRQWNGKTWDELAGMPAPRGGWDDVASASLTSMGIANAIHSRFHRIEQPIRFGFHEAGLLAVLTVGCLFTFTHLRSRTWLRRAFQIVLIGYLGFANGQLLAQSLLAPWAAFGMGWRSAPALAVLTLAAFVIPWATRRQLYCSQICPHGAAQELIGRIIPWRLHLPRGVDRGLRWLPPMLIVGVLIATLLQLSLNLADIEPFDAYLLRSAGLATLGVAGIGLFASAFVPMAYCKYGCPTGLLLSFVRSHGRADRFGRRDLVAGLMVIGVAIFCLKINAIRLGLIG